MKFKTESTVQENTKLPSQTVNWSFQFRRAGCPFAYLDCQKIFLQWPDEEVEPKWILQIESWKSDLTFRIASYIRFPSLQESWASQSSDDGRGSRPCLNISIRYTYIWFPIYKNVLEISYRRMVSNLHHVASRTTDCPYCLRCECKICLKRKTGKIYD